jgi:hypothetical protein
VDSLEYHGGIVEAEANARLVAAAPELLAVVKGFLEVQAADAFYVVNGKEFFMMLAHARAAIAKAEGRAT